MPVVLTSTDRSADTITPNYTLPQVCCRGVIFKKKTLPLHRVLQVSHFIYFLEFPQKTHKNIFATTSRHVTFHIRRRENTQTPIHRYCSRLNFKKKLLRCEHVSLRMAALFSFVNLQRILHLLRLTYEENFVFCFHSQSSTDQACFYRFAFRVRSVENAVMLHWCLSWIAKQTVVFRRSAQAKPTNRKAKTRDVSLSGH